SVKQCDFRCLEHVVTSVPLSGLQEEERFDIAEDRKADRRTCTGVERTEGGRHTQSLVQLDIEVRSRQTGYSVPADGYARAAVIRRQLINVVVEAEVKVDAELFKERFADRDDSHFDRHLQVLQFAERLEQFSA